MRRTIEELRIAWGVLKAGNQKTSLATPIQPQPVVADQHGFSVTQCVLNAKAGSESARAILKRI
jgi:hypothetical protein